MWMWMWMILGCSLWPFGDAFEGDKAGECADGADNDQDGLFDCNDPNCLGSPDCSEDGLLGSTLNPGPAGSNPGTTTGTNTTDSGDWGGGTCDEVDSYTFQFYFGYEQGAGLQPWSDGSQYPPLAVQSYWDSSGFVCQVLYEMVGWTQSPLAGGGIELSGTVSTWDDLCAYQNLCPWSLGPSGTPSGDYNGSTMVLRLQDDTWNQGYTSTFGSYFGQDSLINGWYDSSVNPVDTPALGLHYPASPPAFEWDYSQQPTTVANAFDAQGLTTGVVWVYSPFFATW